MTENLTNFLAPDYSEFPREDDDDILEELDDEDEARIEKLLEERQMTESSKSPFSVGTSGWNIPGSTNQQKPWEQNTPSGSGWGSSGWGSSSNNGRSWGSSSGSSWGNSPSNWSQQSKPSTVQSPEFDPRSLQRDVVVIDVFDCLYETLESNGKPNIFPRTIFDIKPKFEVWEKLQIFSPVKLYIIFPPNELVPAFTDVKSTSITQDYIAYCISTFLRIPRSECQLYQQMFYGPEGKSRILQSIIKDWTSKGGRKEGIIYIGAHSGLYDLGIADIEAASRAGLDFMNVYNLSQGRYIVER